MDSDASSQQDLSHLLTGFDSSRHFPVVSCQDHYAIESVKPNCLVVLDAATTRALQTLAGIKSLRFQAVLDGEDLGRPGHQGRKEKKPTMPVSINIYGCQEVMQEVGKRLSKEQIYLQHPSHLDDVKYSNPHVFVLPGMDQRYHFHLPSASDQEVRGLEVLDIGRLFEEVDHTQGLHVWNANSQIRTSLLE